MEDILQFALPFGLGIAFGGMVTIVLIALNLPPPPPPFDDD